MNNIVHAAPTGLFLYLAAVSTNIWPQWGQCTLRILSFFPTYDLMLAITFPINSFIFPFSIHLATITMSFSGSM